MDKLIIEGGTPLKGTIDISGSKNAALPILFAGILRDAPMVYTNVPDLRDIHTTIKLLNVLGCTCGYDDHRVELTPGSLLPEAPYDLVRTMRASVLCLGPLLARIGQARVALPGGCAIGARPVDQHLKGLELMGATFELEEGYIMGHCDKLRGAHITFDMPTVGGTENLLMAAVLADGETTLENAAREPEVVDLANFLISCGAQIEGHGSSTIRIKGVSSLRGTEYAIMADRIEAGTFLVAAGITGGELLLKNCPFTELESVIAKLESMGLAIEQRPEGVLARCQGVLRGADVKTRPYPGFPTDMQDHGPDVPGRRLQHGGRKHLREPLHARAGAGAHGRGHQDLRPYGHGARGQPSDRRPGHGLGPARQRLAGAGRSGRARHDPRAAHLPSGSRLRTHREQTQRRGCPHPA